MKNTIIPLSMVSKSSQNCFFNPLFRLKVKVFVSVLDTGHAHMSLVPSLSSKRRKKETLGDFFFQEL